MPIEIDLEHSPQTAEVFEGIISTHLYERDITISRSGDEIIYTLSDYVQSNRCLVRIVKLNDKWGDKEILSFSGQYNDIEPCFSTDGKKCFLFQTGQLNPIQEEKIILYGVQKKRVHHGPIPNF